MRFGLCSACHGEGQRAGGGLGGSQRQHPSPDSEERGSNGQGGTGFRTLTCTQIANFPVMWRSLLKAKSRLQRLDLMHAKKGPVLTLPVQEALARRYRQLCREDAGPQEFPPCQG